jgi:hypothetical protein
MSEIPLYKFLDPIGGKLTLGNGTFKHAKPSDFNDVEDLTINGVFPGSIEDSLQEIEQNFVATIIKNLECEPTCASPMREQLLAIQAVLRANPENEAILSAGLAQDGRSIYDIEHMRRITASFVDEINEFLQSYRVLCVTRNVHSTSMWDEYAQGHSGIAVRIEPNLEKDSKFKLFQEVKYQDVRPTIYENPTQFIQDSLFGDKDQIIARCLDKIIYTKTKDWEHEDEYRLVVPVLNHETPWDILPYHPEEVTELYLGAKIDNSDKDEIVGYARNRNPEIKVFRAQLEINGELKFVRFD